MNTFLRHRQLSTLLDRDLCLWLVAGILGHILDQLDNFVTLEDLPENDVATIEMTVAQVRTLQFC